MTDTPTAADIRLNAVIDYHERTKHHLHRTARSLGFLDWANQPDPFRRFDGAPRLALPRPDALPEQPLYDDLYRHEAPPPQPLSQTTIATFLYHSLALSAWKTYRGNRWALRVNPSSGNLHPTEAYLLLPDLAAVADRPGLHHYAPQEHELERRATFNPQGWHQLAAHWPPGTFAIALTSIHWREAWKYGERAWRYCQQDAGHAMAAVRLAAAMLGWRATILPHVHDGQLQRLLGLNRDDADHSHERETPDMLILIRTDGSPPSPHLPLVDEHLHALISEATWHGRANRLSDDHHPWDVIKVVDRATRKRTDWHDAVEPPVPPIAGDLLAPWSEPTHASAAAIIRQRRSAVAMDGRTSITAGRVFHMLARTLPAAVAAPFDLLTWRPRVHLALFVHRVEGLMPGVYLLLRGADRLDAVRTAMGRDDLLWRRVEGAPPWLPLYRLLEVDARKAAAMVSCHQAIAADGAFAAAMLAEFEPTLRQHGPPWYRHLHWEAGMIGQVLYLEAEAAGVRSTGIGCYFDDPTHHIFGLAGRSLQDLYHFTVGAGVEDTRLTTQPPYPTPAKA